MTGNRELDAERADAGLRGWLIATALVVVATIAVGGATRLTESGLSITEWKVVTGVVPPMSAGEWRTAYEQYLQIPEAQTVHRGITLAEFQGLYWWEWAHRLFARLAGLVVTLPFLFFWWKGRIPAGKFGRLASLPVLVLAQGALGWYMVTSGLAERTSVSPYRLVAHLSLALLILGIAVWTAAELSPHERAPSSAGQRRTLFGLIAAIALTMVSGGFVAGLDAGKIFNEFPLMGGRMIPAGYDSGEGVRNLFENPIAAQFNHRLLGTALVVGIWITWLVAERGWPDELRRWMRIGAGVALVQVGLGIATLLLSVPVGLAVGHQLGAVALLSACLAAAARTAGAPGQA